MVAVNDMSFNRNSENVFKYFEFLHLVIRIYTCIMCIVLSHFSDSVLLGLRTAVISAR